MCITPQLGQVSERLIGRRATSYVRRLVRRGPPIGFYRSLLRGRNGLEIGGPSDIFGDSGPLPVYGVLGSLDNCLYSSQTIWAEDVREGISFQYHPRRARGNQIIDEATELKSVEDSVYECVLASHCLEHVANPLRALSEWKRVLHADGFLLLILPHKEATFDWRRPITSLSHMVEDFRNGIGEDDLTHLPEILALHDLEKDQAAGSKEDFRKRCLQNHSNRAMHHHVFDAATAVALVDRAAFQIVRVDVSKHLQIAVLAQRYEGVPDNSEFMKPKAAYLQRSPFLCDHLAQGGAE